VSEEVRRDWLLGVRSREAGLWRSVVLVCSSLVEVVEVVGPFLTSLLRKFGAIGSLILEQQEDQNR